MHIILSSFYRVLYLSKIPFKNSFLSKVSHVLMTLLKLRTEKVRERLIIVTGVHAQEFSKNLVQEIKFQSIPVQKSGFAMICWEGWAGGKLKKTQLSCNKLSGSYCL